MFKLKNFSSLLAASRYHHQNLFGSGFLKSNTNLNSSLPIFIQQQKRYFLKNFFGGDKSNLKEEVEKEREDKCHKALMC